MHAYDLAINNHTLYVLSSRGIEVMNIANAAKPRWIATRGQLSSNAAYRLLAGDKALYLITENGLQSLPQHAENR